LEREVIILGRPYLQTTLLLVKTTTKSKGKTYDRYLINVPRWLGEKLNPRGERKVPVLAYLTRPWIHQLLPLDPEDPIYRSLPEEARVELYYQGLDPARKPRGRVVFIAAEEDEVKALGLDPNRPLTLEDVIRAVERRLTTETPGGEDGPEARGSCPSSP